VAVRMLDVYTIKSREFDSRSGRYQVVTTKMGMSRIMKSLATLCRHVTLCKISADKYTISVYNHPCIKTNSAFYPFGIGKLSTGLSGWC